MKRMFGRLIFLGLAGFSVLSAAERTRDVVVRAFIVPGEQRVNMSWPLGDGESAALSVSGEVTGNFPKGLVFLETDLAANASDTAVSRLIQDKVAFGRGFLVPKAVTIEEIPGLALRLDGRSPSARSKFEEKNGEGRSKDYEIRAEWEAGEATRVRLRMDAGWSAGGGTMWSGFSSDILDQTVDVPEAKLRLIGFRSVDKKSVIWLAVCAVPAAAPASPAGAKEAKTD